MKHTGKTRSARSTQPPPPASAVTAPRSLVLVAALVVAVLAGVHMLQFRVVVDDAFISFRAARHWVQNGLPEYNTGIREWVPTPFLWVALLAATHGLTSADVPLSAQIWGGLAGLATIVLPILLLPHARRAAFIAAAGCAASAAWAAWPLSGMETSFFALIVTGYGIFLVRTVQSGLRRDVLFAGLLAGLAIATRLDAVWLLPAGFLTVGSRRRPVLLGWFGATCFAAALPALLVLELLFGTVLPVSYDAKVHGLANLSQGGGYVLGFARMVRLLYWFPLLIVPLFDLRSRRAAVVLLVLLVSWACGVAVEGGDFMPYDRFLHPIWPLATLAFGYGLVALEERLAAWRPALRPSWRGLSVLVAMLACGAWLSPSIRGAWHQRYREAAAVEATRTAIGRWFAGRYPASEWMAVKPAGIIPYYADMQAVDFFCLVDRKAARTGQWVPGGWIGHQRMNAARIHEIGPKIVILEDRLYPLDRLPSPGATDPNHGKSWLVHPGAARYQARQAEVLPRAWLNYFERP